MNALVLKRFKLSGCVGGDAGAAKAVLMARAKRTRLGDRCIFKCFCFGNVEKVWGKLSPPD